MKGLWIGSVVAILVGVIFGGVGVVGMTRNSDLATIGHEGVVFEVRGGKRPVAHYRDLDGEVRGCSGYHSVGEVILYDPASGRCRAQADMGGATGNEMMFMTFGGVVILLGLLGFLFEFTMARDDTLELVKLTQQGKLDIPPSPGGDP